MREFLRAIRDGFALVCPSCRRGRIFKNRHEMHLDCPECGAIFYRPGEADWLIVWLNAYTAVSIIIIGLIALFQVYTALDLWLQIAISTGVAAVVLAIAYPRFKGSAVGVLHFMRHRWRE